MRSLELFRQNIEKGLDVRQEREKFSKLYLSGVVKVTSLNNVIFKDRRKL